MVIVTCYASVHEDKVQTPTDIEDLIKSGRQVFIVPHIGLVERGLRERSGCFRAFFLITANYIDLPEPGFTQSLGDREADSAC